MNTIDSPLLGLSQRLPPSNLQAEQALLGALLANNRAYERVSEFLAPEHFADPIHGRIYQAIVRRIDTPIWLWPRDPPVRFRKTVPDAWIELTIYEGRNRQVRRMTAAVGLPTLRLIRTRIGDIALGTLEPGETRIEHA